MAAFSAEQRPPRLALGMYKRFLLAAVVIVLATTAAVSTAVLLEIKDDIAIFRDNSDKLDVKPGILDDVDESGAQTLLLLGSDKRYTDGAKDPSRSDTIILLRLDPDRGATAVMSIPRDLRVPLPTGTTGKINAAYNGGPGATAETVRKLFGGEIPIQHIVNVNFGGFQRAVNRLGCIYTDVDRHYFNDNMPPAGGGEPYSVIDVDAGYQRLCGADALSYVRFRHLDNDVVRGARQQDFLRQAKDQVGLSQLAGDRKELIKIFAKYTDTDIDDPDAILRLIKLAFKSAGKPIQEVHIDDLEDSADHSDLIASPAALRKAADQFMNAEASKGPRAKAEKTPTQKKREASQAKQAAKQRDPSIPAGLLDVGRQQEDHAALLGAELSFPTYYPTVQRVGGVPQTTSDRAYKIQDRAKRMWDAYRLVVNVPGTGQYYGIQGTNWMTPPLLDKPSETRKVDGRKLQLFYDGDRLRLVAWKTPKAVYWVSNTLLQSLSNQQMIGIASSLKRVGS